MKMVKEVNKYREFFRSIKDVIPKHIKYIVQDGYGSTRMFSNTENPPRIRGDSWVESGRDIWSRGNGIFVPLWVPLHRNWKKSKLTIKRSEDGTIESIK